MSMLYENIKAKADEEKAKKLVRGGAVDAVDGAKALGADRAPASSALQNAGTNIAMNSAVSSAQSGDALGTIGGGMMTAGLMKPSPASPYLLAGGLGLQVLGAGEANKRKEQEAQRQAYNDRIKARQQAMNNIANIRIE